MRSLFLGAVFGLSGWLVAALPKILGISLWWLFLTAPLGIVTLFLPELIFIYTRNKKGLK